MKPIVEINVTVTETQAEQLRAKFSALPFKISYREEQHGATLVIRIECTQAQEKIIRDIIRNLILE